MFDTFSIQTQSQSIPTYAIIPFELKNWRCLLEKFLGRFVSYVMLMRPKMAETAGHSCQDSGSLLVNVDLRCQAIYLGGPLVPILVASSWLPVLKLMLSISYVYYLTLWRTQMPEAPVKHGTQLKNQIFLKQENHVSISGLKQSLIVSLRL